MDSAMPQRLASIRQRKKQKERHPRFVMLRRRISVPGPDI